MTLPHRGFLLASLFCATLACLLFLPGLPGGFVFDDAYNILYNPGIELRSLDPAAVLDAAASMQVGGKTRVLPTLTFALDYFRGGGFDPATFKITNIAIHALTTLVLAWFLRSLLLVAGMPPARARWMALAATLAWALHPLQVSSVLYVVQRMQTLATLFIVLALWVYLKARQAQIEGRSGRTGLMLAGLLWVVAFGCKEDAVLLPAYTLALELTVLRFRAADPGLARKLRRGYLVATLLGTAVFLFVVAPYYWSWDNYYRRDFSSYERLLTQGRMLCMYLWQIVLPLPSHMPFYYDWVRPSRGLLQPWTTLPALLLLAALLASAWRLRHRRPVFAFGIFLFFSGHFVTSNVIGLELAFEHRNHLPMIGIALAAGDLLLLAADRFHVRAAPLAAACLLALAVLASATIIRARSWNDDLGLARMSTELLPGSERAWNSLCVAYYEHGGGQRTDNPNLGKAIAACGKSADLAVNTVTSLTNVIVYKTLQSTIAQADWERYLDRLARPTTLSANAHHSVWILINNVRNGVALDENRMLDAIGIAVRRQPFDPVESASIGYFILGHTKQPGRAYPYFAHAVQNAVDPSFATALIENVRQEGWPDIANRLQTALAERLGANTAAPAPIIQRKYE